MERKEVFDIMQVPLKGRNLVEASAGTGKTYSIAILVLRFILEQEKAAIPGEQRNAFISIEDILVVTFTKAAVAELQERIRLFIKKAYRYADGSGIDDPLIASLVDRQAGREALAEIRDRLKTALFMIDEANIMTIHGFSQQMLYEYAFETGQAFSAELQNDISDLVVSESNNFWRQEVTLLPADVLTEMNLRSLRLDVPLVFSNMLGGKEYGQLNLEKTGKEDKEMLCRSIRELQELIHSLKSGAAVLLDVHKDVIRSRLEKKRSGNTKPDTYFIGKYDDFDAFYETAWQLRDKKYIVTQAGPFWELMFRVFEAEELKAALCDRLNITLKCIAAREYVPRVEAHIRQHGILTFDSMIRNLHRSLVIEKNKHLADLIRRRYPIIFIDEFQDTDRTQFDIFNELFITSDSSTLFLIGDPKQSIYAFRDADVDSYLEAQSKVTHIYSMNINYRSTVSMVAAANNFFNVLDKAEVFGYSEETPGNKRIEYEQVISNDTGNMFILDGQEDPNALEIIGYEKVTDAKRALAGQVSTLIGNGSNARVTDKGTGKERSIIPSDIGILVRSHHDGKEIREYLQDCNIPAVQIFDEKVLTTKEARDITYILDAMMQPDKNNIRKALHLSFLNFENKYYNDFSEEYDIDENSALNLFGNYQYIISHESVYQALYKLIDDFSLRQLYGNNTRQLRILSNIEQIMQLINQQEHRKGWNAEEIQLWLRKSLNGLRNEGDTYTTQIESDEDAVKIVTIHSSKGLEYNIVLIYGIHKKENIGSAPFITFKRENDPYRYFIEKEALQSDMLRNVEEQISQEQRRLIYVAITRAVYKCYIFYARGKAAGFNGSGLQPFITGIETHQPAGIALIADKEYQNVVYHPPEEGAIIRPIAFNEANARTALSSWRRTSYSALSIHEFEIYESAAHLDNEYEQFIFNELPRGAQAGSKLHGIFEHIDFSADYNKGATSDWYTENQLRAFNTDPGSGIEKNYTEAAREMVYHVLNANIRPVAVPSFHLKDIAKDTKLRELEFSFNIKTGRQLGLLRTLLSGHDAMIHITDQALEGLMNGFIDLFFRHEGKYYILDWKSNYLGYRIEDYEGDKLYKAMTVNNYHLQYLIYTTAVYKYLSSRLPDFDYDRDFGGVVYVFLRGARAHRDSGIFTTLPDKQTIQSLLNIFRDE